MLVGYCVRRPGEPNPPPGLTGVGGAPVRRLEAGAVDLWVSVAAPGPATVERIREHDRVVRAALRSATPLPLRFGTAFEDEGRARERMEERRGELLDALRRVEGRVEIGIRVEWDLPVEPAGGDEAPAGAGPGRLYLERRRREREGEERLRAEAGGLLNRVEACFADLDLATARSLLPEAGVAGTLAHLVHRGDVAPYRERLRRAREASLPARLLPSGPWAPYSFV